MNKDEEKAVITAPDHYTWVPGVECKKVVRHFDACKGQAIKYEWRAGRKLYPDKSADESEVIDLKKAIQWLNERISLLNERISLLEGK